MPINVILNVIKSAMGGSYAKIIAIVIAVIAMAVLAFKIEHTVNRATLSYELETKLEQANKEMREAELEREAYIEKLSAASKKLSLKIDAINDQKVVQIKEVIKYVKDNDDCDVSPGAVRLLNNARTGKVLLSATTELSDGKEQTAPAISQRTEIEGHLQCGNMYRELSAKHDALIDWIENNQRESF